ncbi:winged helix-turn-helix domain-containing protein [Janibacter sp. GXQ6167]|uniref:winged helix-turn-helix domain-containing protein n=1 Tax=Janibacter sp. GXQ6167 TaxID=3240791 RepID=UPI0035233081
MDGWRLLSHPLRSRILAHLRLHGAATSADLARALGTNTGVTSYHLRVLGEAELVEDTGLGNAKTRLWAASEAAPDPNAVTTRFADDGPVGDADSADDGDDVEDLADALWLAHDHVDLLAGRAHTWVDGAQAWPPVWQDECGVRDDAVLVSEEQLAALRAELDAVLARYRRIGAGTPGARRVGAWTALIPLDPLRRG